VFSIGVSIITVCVYYLRTDYMIAKGLFIREFQVYAKRVYDVFLIECSTFYRIHFVRALNAVLDGVYA